MNTTKLMLVILAIAVLLYIVIPNLSWAEHATAASKGKCSHAANLQDLASILPLRRGSCY